MLTYLVNNRTRRKMKVYLYRARSGDDALARIRQYVWDAKVTPFIWMWTPIDCLHEEHLTLK